MMANLSERDKRTVTMGAIAAVGILLIMFVVMPLSDELDKLNTNISKAKGTISNVQESLTNQANAQLALKKLEAQATIYTDPTKLNEQTAETRQEIEALPSYKNLEISRLEDMQMRQEDEFYRSGVSMQFAGSLAQLYQFLLEAGKAQPTLKIERLNVTADAKDPSRIGGQLVISAYAVVLKSKDAGTGSQTTGNKSSGGSNG